MGVSVSGYEENMGIVSKNRKFFERRPDKRRPSLDLDKRHRSSLSSSISSLLSSSLSVKHRGGGPSHLRVVDTSDRSTSSCNGGMTNEEIDRNIESLLSSLDNSNKSNSFSSRFSNSFTSQHSTSSILSCQEIKEQIKLAAINISSRNHDVTIYNEIIDSLLAYLDEPLSTQQQQQKAHSTQGMLLDYTTSLDEAVIDYNYRGLDNNNKEWTLIPIPGVKRCSMLSSSSLSFDDSESSLDESSPDETIVDNKHRQLPSASAVVDYEQYWSKGVIPQPLCPQSPTNYDQDTKLDIASPPTLISFATPGIDETLSKSDVKKQHKKSQCSMVSPDQYYTCISQSETPAGIVSSTSLPFLPLSPGATAA